MMVNTINRLTANNAAYNWMNAAGSLNGQINFNGGNNKTLLSNEQLLRTQMANDGLNYKTGLLMDATNKKMTDDNIHRTFSTFA